MKDLICPHCGAEITARVCEYCGNDTHVEFVDIEQEYELKKNAAFISLLWYNPANIYPGEIGCMGGVRYVRKTE